MGADSMKPKKVTAQQTEIGGLPPGPQPVVVTSERDAPAQQAQLVHLLRIDAVLPDPNQPRRQFDRAGIAELAESIKVHGLLQPITVRPLRHSAVVSSEQPADAHIIIAGERRWRACQMAGLSEIAAIIRSDLSSEQISVVQVIENLQRADLTLTDTIRGVGLLVDQLGVTGTANQLGKDKGWVSRMASVRKLWQPAQNLIDEGFITSVDIAHELATLWALSESAAQTFVGYFRNPPGHRTGVPTRDEIRKRVEMERNSQGTNRLIAEAKAKREIKRDNARGHDTTAGEDRDATRNRELTDDEAAQEHAAREALAGKAGYEARSKARMAISLAAKEQAERLTRLLETAMGISRIGEGDDTQWRTPDGVLADDAPLSVRADTPWINAAVFPELAAVEYTVSIEGAQQVADVELLAELLRLGRERHELLRTAEKHGLTVATPEPAESPFAVDADDLKQVRRFIKAVTKPSAGEHIKASWLREQYEAWFNAEKEGWLLSAQHLAKVVEAAGIAKKRTTGGFVYLDITPRVSA